MSTSTSAFLNSAVVIGIAFVILLPPVVGALREHRVTRQIRRAQQRRDTDETGAGARAEATAGAVAGVVRENRSRPDAGSGGVQAVRLCGQ